jgi:glyoxylase-like metal-dependent hydrolase (beta-lactamase superfamily II)
MHIHHLNCGTMSVLGNDIVVHCVLAETDDGLLLVDTGFGTRDVTSPTPLNNWYMTMGNSVREPSETAIRQVRRLGYAPEDVRHIAVTHCHFDHVGGLPDFPWAKVHILEEEYKGVTKPRDIYERLVFRREHWAHGPDWMVHALQGDRWFGFDCTPPINLGSTEFFFVPLTGHSRGHCAIALRTPDDWLLHCGDAYIYYGEVDPDNPSRIPNDWLIRRVIGVVNKPFREIGRHAPRLRELRREHGDEVRLFCTHDLHEYERFQGGET